MTYQQPPRKRSKWPLIILALVIAAILFWFTMCTLAVKSFDEVVNEEHSVLYEVTSDSGRASIATYDVDEGQSSGGSSSDQQTPWAVTRTHVGSFSYGSLSVSNVYPDEGRISCKITVDGEVVAEQSAAGQFAHVSCSK